MKISVDFSDLWESVRRMGSHDVEFDIHANTSDGFDIDVELSSTVGLDITLEDLEIDTGVLSVKGRQVLLFIPDQGRKIDEVLAGRDEGRRFHVADCQTLNEMREQRRFGRYKATYNVSGVFQVYGTIYGQAAAREGEAALKVCKNCLHYLNYKGYSSGTSRSEIFRQFDIAEFLSTFSTLFRNMPNRPLFEEKGGYSDDWPNISDRYRASVGYTCESCRVDLSRHRHLLHTHHISGNKRENHTANLQALCLDCHRKQPKHEYMRLTHDQMLKINELRKLQGLLQSSASWEQVRQMADQTLEGLLRHYESNGEKLPEVGYEVMNKNHEVVAELEVAWPQGQRGIAIGESALREAKLLGWQVMTVGEALRAINSVRR